MPKGGGMSIVSKGKIVKGVFAALLLIAVIVWVVTGEFIMLLFFLGAAGVLFMAQRKIQQQLQKTQQQIQETQQKLQKTQQQIDLLLSELTDDVGGKSFSEECLQRIRTIRPTSIIPAKLIDKYTMDGEIRSKKWYLDDTSSESDPNIYSKKNIDSMIEKAKQQKMFDYGNTDTWLYQALEKYPIKNKKVAIIGSQSPVYESICLAYGGMPVTIEYQKIISKDPRVETMTVEEYKQSNVTFDAAFSISSFEHDGLGRYGDPLNPTGDLEAMEKTKDMLNPRGILFLAVPIGKDTLVWNAHRIYGKIRLPLLLKSWERIDAFGFNEEALEKEGYYQPIFVLRNII